MFVRDDLPSGRYHNATRQMELMGTPAGLRVLAAAIRSAPTHVRLEVPASASPAPWDGFLTEVNVADDKGLVKIARSDTACLISGAAPFRQIMADKINREASKAERAGDAGFYHVHFEYFPGEECLHETAEPLVVSVSD